MKIQIYKKVLFLFLIVSVAHSAPKQVIAVLPFKTIGNFKNPEIYSHGFPSAIENDLAHFSDIVLVERMQLIQMINELKLHQAGFINSEDIPLIGKTLGATHLLMGDVQKINNHIRILIRMVNVQNSQILISFKSGKKVKSLKSIFKFQDEIAFELIHRMNLTLPNQVRNEITELPTSSYDAFVCYSKGLNCLYRKKITQGMKLLNKARQKDANFSWIDLITIKAENVFNELDREIKQQRKK